jgi:hypothetical protein
VQIALANPHLTGIGFDLPPVESVLEEYVAESRLGARVKFVAGNFSTDPLPKADVVLLGHILRNWNLDEKKTLLRKAYDALPAGWTVVVYEPIIDDERSKNSFAFREIGLLVSGSGLQHASHELHGRAVSKMQIERISGLCSVQHGPPDAGRFVGCL